MAQQGGNDLLILDGQGTVREISLNKFSKTRIHIGRDGTKNEIILTSPAVSREHGKIKLDQGKAYYADMGSSNGTYVDYLGNPHFVKGNSNYIELRDGMVLKIGGKEEAESVFLMFSVRTGEEAWRKLPLGNKVTTIGRSDTNDIILNHPAVSRDQGLIESTKEGYRIVCKSDKCGTQVNGSYINSGYLLRDRDIIRISSYQLIYINGMIFYKTVSKGIGLSISHLSKIVGKEKKMILHDVNCQIDSNEFVAIIGGSGAGKTTLMNAISGFDKNTQGQVLCNGQDLLRNFRYLKRLIGYVPQQDIIYENLTLRQMLEYTARLKMSEDSTPRERKRQIDQVLEMVELTKHQNTCIRKMSGGQKKRASIAVELLADPRLFFLDEPTSGLDPGTERTLMQTLSRLAKTREKTIIMVTHTIQNLNLCDKIIFMGPGGRLCFCGTVDQAKMFFDTDDLSAAYNMIGENPELWEKQFANCMEKSGEEVKPHEKGTVPPAGHTSALRQWAILTSRYAFLMMNDYKRLMILLLQPVIIGLLLYLVAADQVFEIYENTKTTLFAISCSGIWIGLFNSIQEICKERVILKREYMSNLILPVYIMSKFCVQAVIGLVQAVLLSGAFLLLTGINQKGIFFDTFVIEIMFTVWLVILASTSMGLVISAVAKSGDKAMVAAPFVLIVQLLFSGILFKLEGAGKIISYGTVSRWTVEGLGSIADLNQLPLKMEADFPGIIHEAEKIFESTASHLTQDWMILAGMIVLFLTVSTLVLRRLPKDNW